MLALESTKRHASAGRREDIPRKNSLREGHSSRVGSAVQQPRDKEIGGKASSALPAHFCSLLGSASALLLLLLLPPFADTGIQFFRLPTWTGGSGSPGILQALGTRLGYLRYPDSWDGPATPLSASPCRWPLLESPACL